MIAALVESVYGTGSRVSEVLAGLGEPAMPAISRLTTAAESSQRSNAYDLLGLMLAKQRAGKLGRPLSASSFAEARRLLANGLGDRDTVARRNAVRAGTKAQDRGAIPKLKVLAATDPDSGQAGFEWNSVRGLAAAALKEMAREP